MPGAELTEYLFSGAMVLFALAEFLRPRRALAHGLGRRWIANFTLGLLAMGIGYGLLPLTVAALAAGGGIGLLAALDLPPAIEIGAGVLVLDVAAYGFHRLFHGVPVLWRMHRVHHTDLDLDFTSGLRHHPLEVLAVALPFAAVILLFGVPPLAVGCYAAARAVADFATHANLGLSPRLERVLRLVLVTPDMHRIHHSPLQKETDSNFTMLFSCWDRLFGTYREAPVEPQAAMPLGLAEWRDERKLSVFALLLLPFRAATGRKDQAANGVPDRI